MRTFVRNTLIELTKKQPRFDAEAVAEQKHQGSNMGTRVPAPAPPQLPQPRGNRRQRRHQQATMVSVQKQLKKRGINMEMGPVGQRDIKPANKIPPGSDRHETIVVQVGENGQILALVPGDEVEKYLKEHPGAKALKEPALEPTDTENIIRELAVRGDAYVKKPDGN